MQRFTRPKEPEPSAAGAAAGPRWAAGRSRVRLLPVELSHQNLSGRDDLSLSPGPRRKDSDHSATQSGSLRLIKSPSC